MQAQSAQLTLLTRRFDEEEARRKADEARRAVSVFLQVQVLALVQLRVLVVVQRSTCHPCRSSIIVR